MEYETTDAPANAPTLEGTISNALAGQGEATANEPSETTRAQVKQILAEIKDAKKHWEPYYKRMRSCIQFAQGHHWPDTTPGLVEDRIQVDITTRHIQLRTAALYAKNPTIVAKRRETLDFEIWDGEISSLEQAALIEQQWAVENGGMPAAIDPMTGQELVPPEVQAARDLIADVREGMALRTMKDRVGRTMEIMFKHVIHEQNPSFKTGLKNCVPRTLTTGVAYVKLEYERLTEVRVPTEERLGDAKDQIARIMSLNDTISKTQNDRPDPDVDAQELQQTQTALTAQEEVVVREGPVFAFPAATAIIPDKKCRNLFGFLGSDWVAEEFCLSPEDIKETWRVDVRDKYTKYYTQYDGQNVEVGYSTEKKCKACVYLVYNRRTRLRYIVCDGYDDFILAPTAPPDNLEFFWPWFALVFNRVESEHCPFPPSDVYLMMPLQKELNRTLEALRQHRIASKPQYGYDPLAFDDDEPLILSNIPAHKAIPLKGLAEGRKIEEFIQEIKKANIDPNVYTADPYYDAMLRVIGSQEANFGAVTSKGSATEASIAESSRLSSQESNADDLDDLLNALARNCGQMLLRETSPDRAKRIAGRGAMWPQLAEADIQEDIYLEVEAGSSGRPNKAQDLANLEKVHPLLVQIPGLSTNKLLEYVLRVMDDRINVTDFLDKTALSIVAQNGNAQPVPKNIEDDPNAQGGKGGQNKPNNDTSRGPPQGTNPAPEAQRVAA